MYMYLYLESGDKEIYLYINIRSKPSGEGFNCGREAALGVGVSCGDGSRAARRGLPEALCSRWHRVLWWSPQGFAAFAGRSSQGCTTVPLGCNSNPTSCSQVCLASVYI